jgi:hypothetical protein
MDPDAALEELLSLLEKIQHSPVDGPRDQIDSVDVLRVGELVEALDSWFATGGYLPRRWQPARRRTA